MSAGEGYGLSMHEEQLTRLYSAMANEHLHPLWTVREGLMPSAPCSDAHPMVWRWERLGALAAQAGELVPVGRGGERRAIALANPGLGGAPYATPTLWAAIQYLGGHEVAPPHRHSQSAFRFVVEGSGVWTTVDGDAVAMRRGDLLLTPSMQFHEHRNATAQPMMWLDGLDIPLIRQIDSGFFEPGSEAAPLPGTSERSKNERLWGHPGLRPLGVPKPMASPLLAYRWEHTDRALTAQLELQAEGARVTSSAGHAAVRFIDPSTGGDCLRTIRCEMHRLAAGSQTVSARAAGSAVWQVFAGNGSVELGGHRTELCVGDVVVVPSWVSHSFSSDGVLDLFRFSDEPVFDALGLSRREEQSA